MTIGTHIRRLKRWLLPAMLLFLLITAVAFWLWIPNYLKSTLREYTHTKTDGQYVLGIEKISSSFFPLSITINGINLEPVTRNYSSQINNNKSLQYQFKAFELKLQRLEIMKLFREKSLTAQNIKFVRPEV